MGDFVPLPPFKAMTFAEVSDAETIELMLRDESYVVEQKMDGVRVLAHLGPGWDGPVFSQRDGKPVKFAAAAQHLRRVHAHLPELPFRAVVDGELIIATGEYRVFDFFLPHDPHLNYGARRTQLARRIPENEVVSLVPIAIGQEAKRDLLRRVTEGGGEGVMFKNLMSGYQPGVRVPPFVACKYKLVKDADVFVTSMFRGRNEAGREVGSCGFAVRVDREYVASHSGKYIATGDALTGEIDWNYPVWLPMGACSLIGKPQVKVGDVITVSYLYRAENGALIQPRLVRVRTDKRPEDCTLEQFPAYTREVL